MANRWIDGFDHYSTAELIQVYEQIIGGTISVAKFRNGARSWYSQWLTEWFEKWLDNQPTFIAGAALYYDEPVFPAFGDLILIALYDDTTPQCDLRIDSAGRIRVTRNGTTLQITALGVPLLQQWHYLSLKATIAHAGSWEVKLDKTTILSGNGDTQNTANASANRVRFGNHNSVNAKRYMDDVYIHDATGALNNDFWIDPKILVFMPNANGFNQSWTPSAGVDHWPLIDEIPPNSDTDYLYSSVVDAVETNHHEDITLTGVIRAVMAAAWWRKDDAGARQAAQACRSGGANYFGPNIDLGNSYTYSKWIRETDPATGLAWTVAGFNAAEWGGKVIS